MEQPEADESFGTAAGETEREGEAVQ